MNTYMEEVMDHQGSARLASLEGAGIEVWKSLARRR